MDESNLRIFFSAKNNTSINEELPQAAGFPMSFGSNQYYKPFRGVALADIDGIAGDEIILNHDDTLSVIKGDGTILWQKPITGGYANFAPAVGDLNNDGDLEIVATAMYANSYGGINVFDKDGNQFAGFPVQTDNNPILCAPALADINGDDNLEIIFNGKGRSSQNVSSGIHVWDYQGNEIDGFPFEMPSTPATTPTIADINGDGNLEIITTTSSAMFVVDHLGNQLYTIDGQESYKYSYQSPLVVDLEGDGSYSIVGACHGDHPNHYVRDAATGDYRQGWPKTVAEWSYSAPTVFATEDSYSILAGVSAQSLGEVLYLYDEAGNVANGFPISRANGAEGFIAFADINDDGQPEILTESNGVDDLNGVYHGYIYAYNLDGTEYTEGFPLRPQGYTYMNGANIGDVDGDGNMDIVVLSYDNNFQPNDPVYINVYPVDAPIENCVFGTYKGDNTRAGWIRPDASVSCNPPLDFSIELNCSCVALGYLHWQAPEAGSDGNLLGYDVYRDSLKINEELILDTFYEDPGLQFFVYTDYFVNAVYDDGCVASTNSITVYAIPTAVNEQTTNIGLYPNPSDGHFFLTSEENMLQIQIVNTMGQVLMTQNLNDRE